MLSMALIARAVVDVRSEMRRVRGSVRDSGVMLCVLLCVVVMPSGDRL